jgi:hypothetical protein
MQVNRQEALALPLAPELVQQKCSELYEHSRFLRRKYPRLEKLLEDPVAGRCLRLCATQLLRRQVEKTQGH